jgi:hypothetical protein
LLLRLDDIELITRIDSGGKIEEIRSIYNLSISGKRRIVELEIPGLTGNVFQDLGRIPLMISFDGELVGSNTMETIQSIKSKFEMREPIPFSTDIAPITDVSEVVIENLVVNFIGGTPLGCRYSLLLREHSSSSAGHEGGPGETPPPSQEETAKQDVESKTSDIHSSVNSSS